MPFYLFHWTPEIVDYIDQHGISPEEFEAIVQSPDRTGFSRSSGRPFAVGETIDGRTVLCVYEFLDEITIAPVTAYEVE